MIRERQFKRTLPRDIATSAVNNTLNVSLATYLGGQIALDQNIISREHYASLIDTFEPLQHVTNVAASYGIMATTIAVGELLGRSLENRGKMEAARKTRDRCLITGVALSIAYQFITESITLKSGDISDPKDIIYGLAAIVPSYLAARYTIRKALYEDRRKK